jgi:Domain of unknown function (DUF4440)
MAVGQMSRGSDQSKAESARARLCHKQPVDDGPLARQVGTVHAQQPGRGPSMVPQHDSTGVGEAAMDRIVAYEMVGTDPGWQLWDKTAYLESVKSGAFRIESFGLANVKVHVYGDAAVATGRLIVNKHSKSGIARGGARFTDTYVRRNGCWQCVAWQSLGLPLETLTK